jgi:transcription antitermination factor NusG
VSGPFQGFAHVFDGLDEKGRVKAILSMFGRMTPTKYDTDEVAEFSEVE